jgi:hypothetical protein
MKFLGETAIRHCEEWLAMTDDLRIPCQRFFVPRAGLPSM